MAPFKHARAALLELLTENLPGGAANEALLQLGTVLPPLLERAGFSGGAAEVFATARRLVVYLPAPVSRGPAAPCRPRALAGLWKEAILGIRFSRPMLWEGGGLPFSRPIRGVLALWGEEVLPLKLAGLAAGRVTAGLTSLGSPQVRVGAAERYFDTLKAAGVLVRTESRLNLLRRRLAAGAKPLGALPETDGELLTRNAHLCENPGCLLVSFSRRFLKLPPELLRLVLRKQLGVFPVVSPGGRLRPFFLAATEAAPDRAGALAARFRRIFEATAREAVFFHSRDLSRNPASGKLLFSEGLGTSARPARLEIKTRLKKMKELGF